MSQGRQLKMVTVVVLLALASITGQARAAQCGSTSAGFEAWKRQFADEARTRGIGPTAIAALMSTTYSTMAIAADRGQRSFGLSLEQFLAKRGGSAIIARGRVPSSRRRHCLHLSSDATECPRGRCSPFGEWRRRSGANEATNALCRLWRPSLMIAAGRHSSPTSSMQL